MCENVQSFVEGGNANFISGKGFNINAKNSSRCVVHGNHATQVSQCCNLHSTNFFVNNRRPRCNWKKRCYVGNRCSSNIELQCVHFTVRIHDCYIEVTQFSIHVSNAERYGFRGVYNFGVPTARLHVPWDNTRIDLCVNTLFKICCICNTNIPVAI